MYHCRQLQIVGRIVPLSCFNCREVYATMFLPCIRTPPRPFNEASHKTWNGCDSSGGVRIGVVVNLRFNTLRLPNKPVTNCTACPCTTTLSSALLSCRNSRQTSYNS